MSRSVEPVPSATSAGSSLPRSRLCAFTAILRCQIRVRSDACNFPRATLAIRSVVRRAAALGVPVHVLDPGRLGFMLLMRVLLLLELTPELVQLRWILGRVEAVHLSAAISRRAE